VIAGLPVQLAAEIVATFLGILAIWLLARGDGRGWPVGVAGSVCAGWVYWRQNIRGQACLQVVFFVLQLLGWYRWARGEESDPRRSSRLLGWSQRAVLLAGWLLGTWALGLLLASQGSRFSLADAFAVVGSLLGQCLIVAGFAECWLAYLAADVVLVALSVRAEQYFYLAMYLVFCVLATQGWREWTRDDREAKRNGASTSIA
jgi:nicotinamide mononucleotide transporter